MHRVIIGLYFQLISGLIRIRLLLKFDDSIPWIVFEMNNVSSCVRKGLELAIKLFLVTAPWIPVWTDQIISVSVVRVMEHKVCFFYLIYVAYSHSDPGGQLDYPDAPFFYWHSFFILINKYLIRMARGLKVFRCWFFTFWHEWDWATSC